jgi:hypothetical protein
MSFNPNLDVTITPAQETAINDAIQTILTTMAAIGVVNLSPEERKSLPTVGAGRLPYVAKAINELAPTFPAFVGLDITAARAANLFETNMTLSGFLVKLKEVDDRMQDMQMNAENLAYTFTLDLYNNAERYKGRVAGADTIRDELKDLFDGQGTPGNDQPEPPADPETPEEPEA